MPLALVSSTALQKLNLRNHHPQHTYTTHTHTVTSINYRLTKTSKNRSRWTAPTRQQQQVENRHKTERAREKASLAPTETERQHRERASERAELARCAAAGAGQHGVRALSCFCGRRKKRQQHWGNRSHVRTHTYTQRLGFFRNSIRSNC